jgi:hypothetical protein
MQVLVEGLQRTFTANGVTEEHRHKIDDLIVPETSPSKVHLLGKS